MGLKANANFSHQYKRKALQGWLGVGDRGGKTIEVVRG